MLSNRWSKNFLHYFWKLDVNAKLTDLLPLQLFIHPENQSKTKKNDITIDISDIFTTIFDHQFDKV